MRCRRSRCGGCTCSCRKHSRIAFIVQALTAARAAELWASDDSTLRPRARHPGRPVDCQVRWLCQHQRVPANRSPTKEHAAQPAADARTSERIDAAVRGEFARLALL